MKPVEALLTTKKFKILWILLAITSILLAAFFVRREWSEIQKLFTSNTTTIVFLVILLFTFLFLYSLSRYFGEGIGLATLAAWAGVIAAIIIFIGQDTRTKDQLVQQNRIQSQMFEAQNEIDQERISKAEEETIDNTVQSLVAVTTYNCDIAAVTIQSFQSAPSDLVAQFSTIPYIGEPYIENLSFLSQQLNGKYNQALIQAIAYMESIKTLQAVVVDTSVQGTETSMSQQGAALVVGYNQRIVDDSKSIQGSLCSSFVKDLEKTE